MSSVNAPFGLRPVYHPSGQIRPDAKTIASGYNQNILQYQPVALGADGNVVIVAAGAGNRSVGTFMGVEFTDSDGRRRVSNRWLANTVATDIIAYVTLDPQIVYEIQGSAALAQSAIGEQAAFGSIAAGSAVTGLSAAVLDAATLSASVANQLRIIGITPGPDNAFGDPFTVVQVQIAQHQFVADRVPF